jgi:cytochrome c-type biogenesis protein CcmH
MSLWLALVVLAGCAAALLAIPFVRPRAAPMHPAAETDIYKQQLRDLAQEVAAGEVDEKVAADERVAIERRILAEAPKVQETVASPRVDRLTALGVTAVVVLGAVVLYAAIGEPAVPSAQTDNVPAPMPATASATPGAAPNLPDVDTMIARVVARLKAHPNDADGWRMVGWSYFQTQRYPQSVNAYAHAVALKPEDGASQSAYGEALVLAAGGHVTPEALKAFEAALSTLPNDERAHYYLGQSKAEGGDAKGAIAEWLSALKSAQPDSPWAPRLRSEAEQLARNSGIDVSSQLTPAAQPPQAAAPAETAVPPEPVMSPEDRQSAINNMVEGLDARLRKNPDDAEGWVRLIRSRQVLGQADLAKDALTRAIEAFTNDKPTQAKIIAAASGFGVTLDR